MKYESTQHGYRIVVSNTEIDAFSVFIPQNEPLVIHTKLTNGKMITWAGNDSAVAVCVHCCDYACDDLYCVTSFANDAITECASQQITRDITTKFPRVTEQVALYTHKPVACISRLNLHKLQKCMKILQSPSMVAIPSENGCDVMCDLTTPDDNLWRVLIAEMSHPCNNDGSKFRWEK